MLSTEPFGLESRRSTCPVGGRVPEDHPALFLQLTQGIGFGEVPALAMGNGDLQHLTDRISAAEWGFGSLGTKIHPHTAKLKDVVSHQRPGEQTGLAEYLEPVADAGDDTATLGKVRYGAHDGGRNALSRHT